MRRDGDVTEGERERERASERKRMVELGQAGFRGIDWKRQPSGRQAREMDGSFPSRSFLH